MLITITIVLIIGIPFANRYIPYTNTFSRFTDVWEIDPKMDPHYSYRYYCILFGFILTGVSLLITLASFFYLKQNADSILLNISLFLLIVAIGFKNYPYWANGLWHVYGTGSMSSAYDPKALLPETAFGNWWGEVVAWFYLACIIAVPSYFLRLLMKSFYPEKYNFTHHDKWIAGIQILLVCSFFTTPNFIGWLAD